MLRGFVRPEEPDKIIATGSEPLDEYQRKTQSPLIWLNLRKIKLPRITPTWYNQEYAQEAKQLLGQMDLQMAKLTR
jgi:hypothetical protein